MKFYQAPRNEHFIGREFEFAQLEKIKRQGEAAIVVIYGRRRIGKTELIEQFYRQQPVMKFEGIQRDPEVSRTKREERQFQIGRCLDRLANYLEIPAYAKLKCDTWTDFFSLLDEVINRQPLVLYFEEVQWLSNYSSEFLAELKPFWDDKWRHRQGLTIVICGSSPSFIISQFMADKALYARAHWEIHLQEFTLPEIKAFLGKSRGAKEAMLACLSVGGVCEYLRQLKNAPSILQGLAEKSFVPNAFFLTEQKKVFVSSLSDKPHYSAVLEHLSSVRFASKNEIAKKIGAAAGGNLSRIFEDLEICGFIEKYSPLHRDADSSILIRYCLADPYLQFFYKFIKPQAKKIAKGVFRQTPLGALNRRQFDTYLGLMFERWCRKYDYVFANIMGFGKVNYRSGAFFNRKTIETDAGFQIDLMYIRDDAKIVVTEIKYLNHTANSSVTAQISKKIDLFLQLNPQYRNYTIERALITTEGVSNQMREDFDHIITFDEIIDPHYWR